MDLLFKEHYANTVLFISLQLYSFVSKMIEYVGMTEIVSINQSINGLAVQRALCKYSFI